MKRAETKANRLLQIEVLLLAHPEGLSPRGAWIEKTTK
jgi:hypothetical protein